MKRTLKNIKEDQQQKSQPTPSLKKMQQNQTAKNRLVAKQNSSAVPKDTPAVFASKPEPNRGAGDDRRPNVPRNHRTGPTMESFEMEKDYSEVLKKVPRQPQHQGSTHEQLKHLHYIANHFGLQDAADLIKHHIERTNAKLKENAVMSVGSGAVAGIQDPTTNYAFQVQKKKFNKIAEPKIARRKKIKEEFANGIGNTQLNPGTKKEPVKLKTLKDRGIKSKGKKSSTPPSTTSNNIDVAPPTGGSVT